MASSSVPKMTLPGVDKEGDGLIPDKVTFSSSDVSLYYDALSSKPQNINIIDSALFAVSQRSSLMQQIQMMLLEKGYEFLEEDMVCEDGKYYPMMKVRPPVADTAGEDAEVKCWDTVQLKYGKLLLEKQHPVLREYLEREIRIYQSILEGLKAKDSDRIRQRKEELEQELVEAEKGMKYYAV